MEQIAVQEVDMARLSRLLENAGIPVDLKRQIEEAVRKDEEGCICRGNWRAIVKESGGLIGKRFVNKFGNEFTFFGIVHGDDDYYYGMSGEPGLILLSCVGDIEGFGYELLAAQKEA